MEKITGQSTGSIAGTEAMRSRAQQDADKFRACARAPSASAAPPDLECQFVYDLGFSHITVYEPDPHNFDGNDDGVGCKSPN